jgi:hypothetical protein
MIRQDITAKICIFQFRDTWKFCGKAVFFLFELIIPCRLRKPPALTLPVAGAFSKEALINSGLCPEPRRVE